MDNENLGNVTKINKVITKTIGQDFSDQTDLLTHYKYFNHLMISELGERSSNVCPNDSMLNTLK